MRQDTRTLVRQIESRDGKFRVSIFERQDRRFEFEGEELVEDDEDPIAFWHQRYVSGLHDTADGAEHEARLVLPWLRAEGQ